MAARATYAVSYQVGFPTLVVVRLVFDQFKILVNFLLQRG